MSDTPRTDAWSYISAEAGGARVVVASKMEQLERELAAMTKERDALRHWMALARPALERGAA